MTDAIAEKFIQYYWRQGEPQVRKRWTLLAADVEAGLNRFRFETRDRPFYARGGRR
jgi:hypothetical protein